MVSIRNNLVVVDKNILGTKSVLKIIFTIAVTYKSGPNETIRKMVR